MHANERTSERIELPLSERNARTAKKARKRQREREEAAPSRISPFEDSVFFCPVVLGWVARHSPGRRPFSRPLARMSLKSDLTRFFVSRPRLADRTRLREVASADKIPATGCDSSRFHPCRQKRSGSRSGRADVFLRLFNDRFTHNRKTS